MTDETAQNLCMQYVPTKSDIFWRKMGFRYHHGDDSENPPTTGWMMTETKFRFSMGDRLRLLLTGRLVVRHVSDMDTPSPDKVATRLDWHILAPHEK
jgi:hypothetical protein